MCLIAVAIKCVNAGVREVFPSPPAKITYFYQNIFENFTITSILLTKLSLILFTKLYKFIINLLNIFIIKLNLFINYLYNCKSLLESNFY